MKSKSLIAAISLAALMAPVAADAQEGRRGGSPGVERHGGAGGGWNRGGGAPGRNLERRGGTPDANRMRGPSRIDGFRQVQRERAPDRGGDRGTVGSRSGPAGPSSGWRAAGQVNGDARVVERRVSRERDRGWNDRNDREGWNGNRDRDWRDRGRDRDWRNQDRRDWGQRMSDRQRWSGQRRWNSGWRNDRRYDWRDFRSANRARYRLPRYHAPFGWNYGYRRYSIGLTLSSLLFASNYWIDDPFYYRLPPAYGTLRWVRYYDDALLVDVRDGYVVDVIHDFFD